MKECKQCGKESTIWNFKQIGFCSNECVAEFIKQIEEMFSISELPKPRNFSLESACKNCGHTVWKHQKWGHNSEKGFNGKIVCGECNCSKPEPKEEE